MRAHKIAAGVLCISAVVLIIIALKPHQQMYLNLHSPKERKVVKLASYKTWKTCISPKFEEFRGNADKAWHSISQAVAECENGYINDLKIQDFPNGDEIKRHILPLKNTGDPSVIVTLGVGYDIGAEERLQQKMGKKAVEFYGADPMVEINDAMFSEIGTFFPFAVGANPGISLANVFENNIYYDKQVVHVDVIYFLKNLVQKRFIDDFWIDAEGAEYELFGFFYKGSLFDDNGITFCQINMEMHSPSAIQKKQIHDFLFNLLEDERYAFFLPVQGDHLRLFLVNFEDARCVDKYIQHNSTSTV